MDFDALEPGSRELYDSLYAEGDPESVRTLAVEAVRTWNRLCKLDRILSGDIDTWMTLVTDDGGDIKVTVDAALGAARTQASSYRMLIAQIWQHKGGSGGAAGPGDVLQGLADANNPGAGG